MTLSSVCDLGGGVDPDVPLDRTSKQITERKVVVYDSGTKEG